MKQNKSSAEYRSRINTFLNQSMFASVAFLKDGHPLNRMYIFASDLKGNIYIRTRTNSSLCSGCSDPEKELRVSISIYREEPELNRITSLTVEGVASLVKNRESDNFLHAYSCLGKKSPLIGQTPFSPDKEKYTIIRITPEEFRIRDYSEYLSDQPQPVLRRN